MPVVIANHWSTSAAAIFSLGVMLLTLVSLQVGFFYWNIASGVLFAALWMAPTEWWWLVFLGAIVGRHLDCSIIGVVNGIDGNFLSYWNGPVQYFLGVVAEPFMVLPGVLFLRTRGLRMDHEATLQSMGSLHISAVISAVLIAAKDLLYVWNDGWVGDVRSSHIVNVVPLGGDNQWNLLSGFAIQHVLGYFVGIVLVAALVMWLVAPRGDRKSRTILRAGVRFLLPAIVLYIGLALTSSNPGVAELLRMLLLVMIVLFALHYGWRGAVLSILSISVAVAIGDHLEISPLNPLWVQMYIAIAGAMGLLFGVAVDDMRKQTISLEESHIESSDLLQQLREVALRNLKSEERERQRLAGELHDEFGQNLAALQTRIKLAEPQFVVAGVPSLASSLMDLTLAMRQNIGRVLESLKPASLAELGLYGAIDRGSVRQTLEDANVSFEVDLSGDARLLAVLDDSLRVAAYRLVQEATTNVVRHARATRCTLRLRINSRGERIWLFVDVRDDGIGMSASTRLGHGLRGMHDRVRAMNGALAVTGVRDGVRVHALFRDIPTHVDGIA